MIKATVFLVTAIGLLSGAAYGADLALPAAPVTAPPPVAGAWNGAYIGANAGYSWGTATPTGGTVNISGWQLGGEVGYNFDLADPLVVGIAANIDWMNESGSGRLHDYGLDWDGAVVGRLGADLGDLMPYVEGGLAVGGGVRTLKAAPHTVDNATYVGWTVGGGLQYMFAQNWSGDLQYRYSDYGTQTVGSGAARDTIGLTNSSVTLGIDYHF
jgi:outer membrane immunogenic protein